MKLDTYTLVAARRMLSGIMEAEFINLQRLGQSEKNAFSNTIIGMNVSDLLIREY